MRTHQDRFPYALTSLENQTDDEHHFRIVFVLFVSLCGLIGLIGNGLLLCFYGNKRTRTYRSRDAIYIRRMAFADFLICFAVIPYSVLFESDLITNDYACKTMECFRHFMVYFSHLLLYTYSWELPRRHMYSASKTYNTNTMIYSILMSVLGAAPTIFIFRAEKKATATTTTTRYLPTVPQLNGTRNSRRWDEPPAPSCHLITNIVPQIHSYDVKSLTWLYVVVPLVVYSMSLYWFLINFAAYLNSVDDARKDSLFLTKLEDVFLIQPNSESRSGSTTALAAGVAVAAAAGGSGGGGSPAAVTINGGGVRSAAVAVNGNGGADKPFVTLIGGGAETSTTEKQTRFTDDGGGWKSIIKQSVAEIRQDNEDKESDVDGDGLAIVTRKKRLIFSSEQAAQSYPDIKRRSSSRKRKRTRFRSDPETSDSDSPKSKRLRNRRATGLYDSASDFSSELSTAMEGNTQDDPDIKIIEFNTASVKSTTFRPILKNKAPIRNYPRVGSYKKSLATLIMCDLIMVPVVMATFLISGGNSVVLSIVHLKSVLSFYALSVLNPYLRKCVWRQDKCVCFPPASDKRRLTPNQRASALQVNYLRERFQQRQEVRRLRMEMDKRRHFQNSVFGTEI